MFLINGEDIVMTALINYICKFYMWESKGYHTYQKIWLDHACPERVALAACAFLNYC